LSVERVNRQPRSGKALVNVFRRENLQYGQRILLTGKFHKPFPGSSLGHFSYEDYLKRNGIYWMLSVRKDSSIQVLADGQGSRVQAFSLASRHRFKSILEQYLNDLEAGVIQSLVLGGRYYIPDSVRQVFVETGTAHILAISGMNIGAIALLIVIMLSVARVPRRLQLFLTIIFLAAYAYFTGANPSVVRATVMAVVFLAGFLWEREQESLNSLGLAALVILVIDPLSLMDIGFQLSFMGVFSIIYFYPCVYAFCAGTKALEGNRFMAMTVQALCMSAAAWVGVAPLIAYYFQIVTPVTVLANLPIIPFVSALMMLGVGLMAAAFVSPWLAASFAACIKAVLVAMMVIIEAFGRVPWGHWPMKEVPVWALGMYYSLVLALFYWLDGKIKEKSSHDHAHFLS
jgi:competence protein ComEC